MHSALTHAVGGEEGAMEGNEGEGVGLKKRRESVKTNMLQIGLQLRERRKKGTRELSPRKNTRK